MNALRAGVCAVFLLMCSMPTLGEERLAVRGSFVIAVICKDGVVMAADSRANIFDATARDRTPLAYYDTMQKVFPVGPSAIAATGPGLVSGIFFSAIVDAFVRENPTDATGPVNALLPSFIRFCDHRLPPSAATEINQKMKLFAAGGTQKERAVCYYNKEEPSGPFRCVQGWGMVESAKSTLDDARSLARQSCERVATQAEQAIISYVKHGARWKTIGGPIQILRVGGSVPRWIKNKPPPQRWKYVSEMTKDYRDGKVPLTLIPPATRQLLDTIMAE